MCSTYYTALSRTIWERIMEYVDSTDELAYITSLEQQNSELMAALDAALHKMLLGHDKASSDSESAWLKIHQAEDIIRNALWKVRK